jgi:DNA-binding MarR family transcriptional regulator
MDGMSKLADDLLRRAGAAQRLAMERALRDVDLTPAQFAAMEWLAQAPGLSGSEIAKRERLTPPTSSVIVANLERKGLVIRQMRKKGGRAQHLELTHAGCDKLALGALAVENTRRRLAEGLEPRTHDGIMNWLERLANIDV